jgi:hypothetical protein
MKPQYAERQLIGQAYQVVPPSRMGQLVHEHGIEFPVAQEPIDSNGQGDLSAQQAGHGGAAPSVDEFHCDAIGSPFPIGQ